MANIITTEELKTHLIIDHTDDDYLVELYRDIAETFLYESLGVTDNTDFTAAQSTLAKAYVLMLASQYYEQRIAVGEKALIEIPNSLRAIFNLISLG